jgi:hypothetical protein
MRRDAVPECRGWLALTTFWALSAGSLTLALQRRTSTNGSFATPGLANITATTDRAGSLQLRATRLLKHLASVGA